MTSYRGFTAPVAGGPLAGGVWNEDAGGVPVLAVHGITASHLSWPFVAERLAGIRVIAPDLRGRARSNGLPAPFGFAQHAEDVLRVLDVFEVERAVVVGHSMGAFVSVLAAASHPDRVAGLVLVDGGLPIPPPAGLTAEEAAAAVLGPALARLAMEFSSVEDYLEFWRAHPAFAADWSDEVAAYARYDLDGEAPYLRASSNPAAIAENSVQLDGTGGYLNALQGLRMPADFIRAPRGLLNAEPLYSPEQAAEALAGTGIRSHEAQDVNHYTVVMSGHGADQVAPVVRAQWERATKPVVEGRVR